MYECTCFFPCVVPRRGAGGGGAGGGTDAVKSDNPIRGIGISRRRRRRCFRHRGGGADVRRSSGPNVRGHHTRSRKIPNDDEVMFN